MVNAQVLQGQWNQVRGELKKKWGQLTDDDLRFNNGNIDQLVGKIQQPRARPVRRSSSS